MEEIYIESVTITPNPVIIGTECKIEVEIYELFPALELYPANDQYPGADIMVIYPQEFLYPGSDLYPAKGEHE